MIPAMPARTTRHILCALLFIGHAVRAADWPQWRGALRDGATTESEGTNWPGGRPREIWRAQVGAGHAPVCVAGGRAVTLGYANGTDTVWCFEAASGKPAWRFDYPALGRCRGEPGNGAYDGPHAAPLIYGGRVYTLSRDGQAHCLLLDNGTCVWKRDLRTERGARLPECGFAGSPLSVDDTVVVSVGTAGTALDAATGRTRWDNGSNIAGYASPVLAAEDPARRRLLLFGFRDLAAVDPATGGRLWSLPWPTQWGVNVADPVVTGRTALVSSAYGRGCAAVDLDTGTVRWQNQALRTQCSPPVLYAGSLFGFDGFINYAPDGQSLVCLDPADGAVRWRRNGLAGQVIRASDRLVLLLTTGDLVVVRATPRAYEELARSRILPAEECPVPPALSDGRLFVRTGRGLLACLDVASE